MFNSCTTITYFTYLLNVVAVDEKKNNRKWIEKMNWIIETKLKENTNKVPSNLMALPCILKIVIVPYFSGIIQIATTYYY